METPPLSKERTCSRRREDTKGHISSGRLSRLMLRGLLGRGAFLGSQGRGRPSSPRRGSLKELGRCPCSGWSPPQVSVLGQGQGPEQEPLPQESEKPVCN